MIDPVMLAVYPVSHEVPPSVLFDAESQIDLGVFVKLIPQGRRATLWRRNKIKVRQTAKSVFEVF